MKFISSEAKLIEENSPYKLIERIGRMCYKSEDKITEDSCYNFVKNLADRKHYAMLEHANLHFKVLANDILPLEFVNIPFVVVDVYRYGSSWQEYIVTVSMSHMYQYAPQLTGINKEDSISKLFFYMWKEFSNDNAKTPECYEHCPWTVNYIEESDIEDLTDNQEILDRHIFKSIKFTCDRGVSHELVRHRCAVAQESTRYVASSSYKPIAEFNLDSDDDIISAYLSGFSMRTISEHCQLTEWQVRKLLLSNQVPIRGLNSKGRRDETYFDNIDEPEKAYLLGMIQTDGSIDKSGSFTITQHKDYMWYIEAMFHKFTDYVCKFEDNNCYQIMIGCKHMVDTLINYGIVPNKTYSQTDSDIDRLWACVPDEFKGDFIRGMIDGDGHVRFKVQKGAHNKSPEIELYSSNKHILELIKKQLNDRCSYECRLYNTDGGYTLHICKYSASIDIGNYLYKHFQFPFGHPKKTSNWLDELSIKPDVANYIDQKFQVVIPSTWNQWKASAKFAFLRCLTCSELSYKYMREQGMKPEQARAVLPNALKTEVVLTMSLQRWKHFFDIRLFDKTGKAHPDMKEVSGKAYEILKPYLEK